MGPARRLCVTLATAGLLAGATGAAVPGALAARTPALSSQQTRPRIKPRVGRPHSTFHLTFTLASTTIRAGFETTEYRAVVSAPTHSRASCAPPQPAPIVSGNQGSVAKIALRPSAHGWCRGRYAVTIYLETIVTCGPLGSPGSAPCCGPPVEAAELPRIPYCPVSADPVR